MKKLFIAIALVMGTMSASAQIVKSWPNFLSHLSVGVEAGTTGVGFSAATTINQHIEVRAGMNFMPNIKYDDNVNIGYQGNADVSALSTLKNNPNFSLLPPNIQSTVNQAYDLAQTKLDQINVEGKLNISDFNVMVDLYPSKNNSFHFTVGFYTGKEKVVEAYNTNQKQTLGQINSLNGRIDGVVAWANDNPTIKVQGVEQAIPENILSTMKDMGKYKIGADLDSRFIEPDAKGDITADLRVSTFKPYVGIGWGRTVPKSSRVSLQFEAGAQFWGKPTVYAQDEKIEKNDFGKDGAKVFDLIEKFTVYPVFKLRLNGRIF